MGRLLLEHWAVPASLTAAISALMLADIPDWLPFFRDLGFPAALVILLLFGAWKGAIQLKTWGDALLVRHISFIDAVQENVNTISRIHRRFLRQLKAQSQKMEQLTNDLTEVKDGVRQVSIHTSSVSINPQRPEGGGTGGREERGMGRILVVDDDEFVRQWVRFALEQAGHEIIEAADGREALDVLADGIDCVVLDLMMPVLAGNDVLAELSRWTRGHPPILVLSAYLYELREEVRSVPFGVLPKPVRSGLLQETVAQALAQGGRAPEP